MITGGTGSGTGKYSFHSRHSGQKSVKAIHMPEDEYKVRIVFELNGECIIPKIITDYAYAEMLWACLNEMAKDLKWEDFK